MHIVIWGKLNWIMKNGTKIVPQTKIEWKMEILVSFFATFWDFDFTSRDLDIGRTL